MNVILQVAVGGALGAVLRYLSMAGVMRVFAVGTPLGTVFVNILGSFVMGLFAVWLLERVGDAKAAPFVMVGVLGGFTTFSAFSLDAFLLWEQGRIGIAMLYVFGSVIGAVGALMAGILVMRAVMS